MQKNTNTGLDHQLIRYFQQNLLEWYSESGRDLPWRHTSDPYQILVSEIMLHQTQVDRVLPKYLQWIQAYPSFQALAAAPLSEVEALWRPLGYNFRPIRLHKIAQRVISEFHGQLPNTREELTAIKGIGRYTAGAILSFAFHKDAAIVDTNIRRVIQRIFNIQGNSLRAPAKKHIWQIAEAMIPQGQAYTFNQAIMDFGALVCVARKPHCQSCFMNGHCRFLTVARS
ncbi:MAG: A/G-specific adenine glycosylase [Candidatus Bathyarchaeota archaeon]|nr:A/G-specific adenine glycosylase [Candidatus Bathyarchaeota archaeon]